LREQQKAQFPFSISESNRKQKDLTSLASGGKFGVERVKVSPEELERRKKANTEWQ